MRILNLSPVARSALKSLIVALGSAGLISQADTEHLIKLLGLRDA